MALANKNQRAGMRGGERPYFQPDDDCLRKYNYSNGAGWRTKKPLKSRLGWGIRRKVDGGRARYIGV